ncbi:MAG: DUF4350 domain-containing protein [Rubricoccaceae bacterium]|nr:DUF4350 domain-containing protein [Rubricoccaceae bacterium]
MTSRLPLLLVGLLAAAFVVFVALQPTPPDWRPTYERASPQPLGTEVFYTLLADWVGAPVTPVLDPPFLRLADSSRTDLTYLFLTDAFAPDEAEAHRLLRFAARGGTVGVAADEVAGPLADSLGRPRAAAEAEPWGLVYAWNGFGDGRDSLLHLTSPALRAPGGAGYRFPLAVARFDIEGLDPERTTVLGLDGDSLATFVRVRVGEGQVLLLSTPLAFTNAALVGEGDAAAYLGGVLGYVPRQPVLWDDYHKPFRAEARTPLRVVLQSPPLRWAYGLVALGTVLFVLFRGRRWQRPVPVVAPPPNALVGFVETVGRLYWQQGDRRALVARRRRTFLDRLRVRLHLDDVGLDEATERRVVQRSGLPERQVAALFARFRRLDRTRAPEPRDLLELDRALDRFYDAVGR